jgi:serine/threonine protein kinase/tetratricopeptide (TPR) repeat protein
MTTWNPKANDLFLKVLELGSPEQRRASLDQACAGNPELRAQVEALLRASERAGRFLERPALARADHDQWPSVNQDGPPGQPPGAAFPEPFRHGPRTRIGPYKLLQPIGEGGMGVVYLAEQEQPVRRQVALKIIKPGLDSEQVMARFEAERQALALMDHPHIARVFEGGTTEAGRPFFVMELVKGVPLTRHCDEARLSVRQRLELFLPVCQAVQHAHQKGVIHRDLKPSNLLVALYDGRPVPKVIDFGVAKATGPKLTERTLFTAFGTMVGTLEYMAPEQAELNQLDVDTRSDIYSLGVVLYELLTGTTPLERHRLQEAGWAEILRLIRQEEPPKPSTRLSQSQALPSVAAARQAESRRLCQLLEGDLDWITMKALAKERDRRYETANALAGDLERYLRDEPVLAGPPGAGYRLRKLVRRHKGKVAAGAAMLALLVAGVVASTWQAVRATRAEQAAREALSQVTAEQSRTAAALAAEAAARAQARRALDTLTDDVVQTLFAKQPALGEAEKAFLRKVLGFYEEFTRPLGDTAEARVLRARGYFKVASLRARLGAQREAEEAYRQSLTTWEELAAEFPKVAEYRSESAHSWNALGIELEEQGKLAGAETAYRRALTIREQLAAEFPALPEYRQFLARSHSNLSLVLRQLGKYGEAETALRRALARHEQLATEFPAVPECRADLAASQSNLGKLLRQRGRPAEAEVILRQAVDHAEKLAADFAAVPRYRTQLAGHLINLGNVLLERQWPAEALACHDRALALLEPLHQQEPGDAIARQNLHYAHWGRAQALDDLKRHCEALAHWDQALELSAPAERPTVQLARARNRLYTGKATEAVADAEALTQDPATPGGILCDGACLYALAAALQGDAGQRDEYTGQALALLRRAQARGFFRDGRKVEAVKQHADLEALRPREDFQKFVAELEAAATKPEP